MITLNACLAGLVALLAIGTFNKMNGTTNNAVRCAVLLLFGGFLGQAFGFWTHKWDFYLDTMVFGAAGAYLLACRRMVLGIPNPYNEWLSYALSIGTFVFVMVTFPWGEVVLAWQVSR